MNAEWTSGHREACRRNIIEWYDSMNELPTAMNFWGILLNIIAREMEIAGYTPVELLALSESTWRKQDIGVTIELFTSGIYLCYSGKPVFQTVNALMKHLAKQEKEHLERKSRVSS